MKVTIRMNDKTAFCTRCGREFPKEKLVIYGLIPLIIYCEDCLEKNVPEDEDDDEWMEGIE